MKLRDIALAGILTANLGCAVRESPAEEIFCPGIIEENYKINEGLYKGFFCSEVFYGPNKIITIHNNSNNLALIVSVSKENPRGKILGKSGNIEYYPEAIHKLSGY